MKMYFVPLNPEETYYRPGNEYVLQVMKAVLLGLEGEGVITSSQLHDALKYLRNPQADQ